MSSTEGTPARRRGPRRAADLPRVPELEALLRDVDELRLTLETDLSLAASAVEAGVPQVAADILGAEREAVADFEARALGRLGLLADEDAPRSAAGRRRPRVPAHAATFVAAAALVGVLAGVVPQAISGRNQPSTPVAAVDSLERLQELATGGDASEIREVSTQLHQELAGIVAVAGKDPAAAQNALLLLSYEQVVIAHSADRGALADVLRQSQALARAIRAALPASVRVTAPRVRIAGPAASAPQSPKPGSSTSSKTASKPSPRPSTASSPAPAPQPSSSPSSSPNPYQLPGAPLAP